MRVIPVRSIALAALLCVAFPAAASLKKQALSSGPQQPVGIALDASGRVHFSWVSKDYHLHHSWLENGKKRDEVVDATSDCGFWSSIALDSAGHPHIAYHAERLEPTYRQVLVHAHFDGSAWQIEELGPGGYGTAIAIDADDQPHIAHAFGTSLGTEYLHLDDGVWERETPPELTSIWFTPLSLALDAAGNAHIVLEDATTRRPVYATNTGGDWTATELAQTGGYGGSLALDSQDRPHVALPLYEIGAIRYSHFDGMEWISEDVFDPNDLPTGLTSYPEAAALALDANDRPQLLFSSSFSDGSNSASLALFAMHDGSEWRALLLPKQNTLGYLGLVSAPDGVAHGVYTRISGDEKQKATYVRIALHDLAGEWTSLAFSEAAGTSTVSASCTYATRARQIQSSLISFYLSDDATFDPATRSSPSGGRSARSSPAARRT
jgi:hypothetical protein